MPKTTPILLRNVELNGLAGQDVLIAQGVIRAIGNILDTPATAQVIDAEGGALLPGLKDHHLHMAALAVSRDSVSCSPADVGDAAGLRDALQARAQQQPGQWLRGLGYCESVAGEIDVRWLDAVLPDTAARIQHRGGRLWILNSAALDALQVTDDDPLERADGRLTGRLYEGDLWLRERRQALGQGGFPDLSAISRELASYGITDVTDTTPTNNQDILAHFVAARACGELLQDIRLMGDASLDGVPEPAEGIRIGEHKFHLLESNLPDISAVIAAIASSHAASRNVAFHCVTRTELLFALAALEQAGTRPGDRIEHASVTPPELLPTIKALGLIIVTQPGLIAERGDHYLANVEADDQPHLYRLKSFLDAGIPLAGSSDAPYTDPNPWLGMQAAVSRRSRGGVVLGQNEGLTPEQALALYTSELVRPGSGGVALKVGAAADLCLLAKPWQQLRDDLNQAKPRLTLKNGQIIWNADAPASI